MYTGLARQRLTPRMLGYRIAMPLPPPDLKLCLATANHNFKWVNTILINACANLEHLMLIPPLILSVFMTNTKDSDVFKCDLTHILLSLFI